MNLQRGIFFLSICMSALFMVPQIGQAQTLWANIKGNEAQIKLADTPTDEGIATDKIAESKVIAGDKTLQLNPQNNQSYLSAELPANANLVGASNDWGVIKSNEPGGKEYHLRYFAKAARTLQAAVNSVNMDAQWYLRYGYGKPPGKYWDADARDRIPSAPVVARLVKEGVPVANAEVRIYNPAGKRYNFRRRDYFHYFDYLGSGISQELYTTDKDGKVLFYVEEDGDYRIEAEWKSALFPYGSDYGRKSEIQDIYHVSMTVHIRKDDIDGFDTSRLPVNEYDRLLSEAWTLRFSEDSKKLVSAGYLTKGQSLRTDFYYWGKSDKRLRVWDVQTGKEIQKLPTAPADPRNTVIMPDLNTMFTWGNGGYNEIDVHTFHFGRLLENHNGNRASIELSPDRELFAVGATREVDFVDAKTLKTLRKYYHDGQAAQVFWGPNSKTLIMRASGGKYQAIDVATAKQIHYPHWVYRVQNSDAFAFSPNGNFLAKANDKTVEIWETPTENNAGKRLNKFETKIDRMRVLQFSPDGKTLAVGGSSTTTTPVQFIKLKQTRK